MRWLFLVASALAMAASPEFRLERVPVTGGAELITVFSNVPDDPDPVPLVSILRDTLGDSDPANDRLRYVWTLTSASPTLLQRAAAAIPFFYGRTGLTPNADKTPKPAIDLADTSSSVWDALAQQVVQVTAMDPNGMFFRAPSRRYRTNVTDQRSVHLMEALAVMSQLEHTPGSQDLLSSRDLFEIQARMELASQTLGGLVTEEKLPEAYLKQRSRREQTRGHNWELLRQRAEANGLYFEPLGLGTEPSHAILWIALDDAKTARRFDGKFLKIGNPYGDARIRNWKGVRVTRYFDPQGHPADPFTLGATARQFIPLAMYGLNYPKVPLLLIDFRDAAATKRREILANAITDVVMGIVGYSKWGNWPYMAGSFAVNFAATRWGAATNRQLRLKAYAEVRRWLTLDGSLSPELRLDLQKRLEVLGVNPLDASVFNQTKIARKQYVALMADAANPLGLAARLERDRAAELAEIKHGAAARTGMQIARIATFGAFKHREPQRGAELNAALDASRRGKREIPRAETLAHAGPQFQEASPGVIPNVAGLE